MATNDEKLCMADRIMEHGAPDSTTSPGAVWCGQLHDSLQEAWNKGEFEDGNGGFSEVDEIAETSVPTYTHNAWQIFVDLTAYESGESEEVLHAMNHGEDITEVYIKGVLERLAKIAAHAWLEEKREAQEEAERDAEERQAEYDAEYGDGLAGLGSYGS